MRSHFWTLLVVASVLLPSIASAQDDAEMKRWQEYLARAAQAYDAGDREEALLLYGRARSIYDPPKLRYTVARLHETLEECTAAELLYVELTEAEDVGADIRRRAARRLQQIDRCGIAPPEPFSTPNHTVESETDVEEASAAAEPKAAPHIERRARPPYLTWGLAGLGTTGLVTAAAFADGIFLSREERDCFFDGACSPEEFEEVAQTVRTQRLLAAGALGASVIVITASAILHATRGPKRIVRIDLTPSGVALSGRF